MVTVDGRVNKTMVTQDPPAYASREGDMFAVAFTVSWDWMQRCHSNAYFYIVLTDFHEPRRGKKDGDAKNDLLNLGSRAKNTL